MSDERNVHGQFERHTMGSEAEQFRAGVNTTDTELSASMKVHAARMDAINQQYGAVPHPFAAGAAITVANIRKAQMPYYYAVIAALALIGWVWWASAISYPTWTIASTSTFQSSTRDAQQLTMMRNHNNKEIAYLFKEGAPLSSVYNSCAVSPCVRPDLRALDSLRSMAADTTTPWDKQVCRYFTMGYSAQFKENNLSHLGIDAAYRLDRAKGECILTNYRQMKERTDLFNNIRHGIALLAIIAAIWLYRRKINQIDKNYPR